MKNLKCGSIEYKQAVREFAKEWWNRPFTYNEFINWLMNKRCRVGTPTGQRSYEQAVFDSTLNHEHEVIKTYETRVNHLETIFTIVA